MSKKSVQSRPLVDWQPKLITASLDTRTVEPKSLTLNALSAAPRSRRATAAMEAKVEQMLKDETFIVHSQSEFLVLGDGTPIAFYLGCGKGHRGGHRHKNEGYHEPQSHGIPVSCNHLSAPASAY